MGKKAQKDRQGKPKYSKLEGGQTKQLLQTKSEKDDF